MKKITLYLFMLLTTHTYANSLSTAEPSSNRWSIGFDALYIQPDLGEIMFRGLKETSELSSTYLTHPVPYLWGFNVHGKYHFSNIYDVNLEWYSIKKDIQEDFGGLLSAAGDPLAAVSGDIIPNLNAVNIEFGRMISLSNQDSIRLHLGLEYAQITVNENRFVVLVDSRENGAKINRSFKGLGARIGTNLTHHVTDNFNVYGNFATALLAGTQSSHVTYTHFYDSRYAKDSPVVTELDFKLGANYNYPTSNGAFILDAGWMWVNYLNSIVSDNYNLLYKTVNLSRVNLGGQGLFLGIKWKAN